MLNRGKTQKDNIRAKIKHENARLGAGTEMGGMPNNRVGVEMLHGSSGEMSASGSGPYSAGVTGSASAGPAHQYMQHTHNLGAGPSFVSLSPSDSISNFEGRPGQYPGMNSAGGHAGAQSVTGQLFEPSAGSTASFALGLGDPNAAANAPLRPARSMRRPQRMSVLSQGASNDSNTMSPLRNAHGMHSSESTADTPVGRNLVLRPERADSGGYDSMRSSDTTHVAPAADRHAKSARLMAQVNRMEGNDGRETPMSDLSDQEDGDGYGGNNNGLLSASNVPSGGPSPTSPPLGSLTQEQSPSALGSVLSALSSAGRKQGQARILRGTTAEEESRRRRIERKVEAARTRESKPLESYVDRDDEKAFRQISAVLRKSKAEWDFLVDDDFNSVSLAFSLLDESSLGANRDDFEDMKELIERALQGTVDDHYESFATAISLHNNVINSFGSAQNGVSSARRRLRDAREALGAKRADLVQLWHRSQGVKESLRLLDMIENLKSVPDRLESLMAEKQFLEAVNLLTRASKNCEKADILEVGATSDLRAYLKGQEQAMFDILIEELHNHLYLKSYFCDARWKSYTPGQTSLPNVDFGQEYEEQGKNEAGDETERVEIDMGSFTPKPQNEDRPLKIFRYLKSLSVRPAPDSNMAGDLEIGMTPAYNKEMGAAMATSQSTDNMAAGGATNGAGNGDSGNYQQSNPETDSFLYIEMLLESLAKLGKIKLTQEVILQRLPTELHQLVDATIDEVDSRSEMMRRSSVAIVRAESLLLASSSALARSFAESARNSFRSSFTGLGNTAMRLPTMESNQVERDCETMRDLFWTLFSKLDAVLQGHRVVFEVITKISSRGASSAYKAVKVGRPASLIEIWRPLQTEVRTLLHEHLVDESEGSSARRNAVVSVNEVLRQGSFQRDRSKSLFRLAADSAPKPGVHLSRKDFAPLRRHEEALTNALRASVPGLVGGADATGNSAAVFQQQHQQQQQQQQLMTLNQSRSGFVDGAGHKLLVKPDAFNISVLFQPALAFIERVKMLLPPEAAGREGESSGTNGENGMPSTGFSRFLDEFVRDVFLSQLEDKVQSLFTTAVGGADAFQEDTMHKTRTLGRPIARSVANVIVLIDSLYAMLRTTPFHRESYSLLIIQTIVQYYQKCYDRYRDLILQDTPASDSTPAPSTSSNAIRLSAMWAQRPEISNCLVEMLDDTATPKRRKQLMNLENSLELQLTKTLRKTSTASEESASKSGTISLLDLTTSRKKLMALGNLHHTLLWFYDHITKLKAVGLKDAESSVAHAAVARLSVVAGSLHPMLPKEDDEKVEDELKLPLSQAMIRRYEALPKTFQHLSHLVLFTLRLEVRARTIHHLDLAINEGNYLVEDAVLEPDPHIVDLNAELASLDDIFAETILPQHHRFLFSGLASLMDLQLCKAIRKVRFINRHGLTKMIRNIMALQQNLRNIVPAVNDGFERCRKLWELVGKTPDEVLGTIRQTGAQHSFEEYHAVLKLILGLENGQTNQAQTPTSTLSNFAAQEGQGPLPPNANLRPGTVEQKGEVSRQKIDEYLIELHEVAGEAF
ncbi:uncharacterized protein FA14DRAFT_147041 [Meira miltonrushii]|uniref:Exocyst complex component Sec8 n=1 Tax=Meira miltonrushii TaxID=1280837 RepID=A0A316V7T1_9BASI|nr:uncharacterized protein FA14DRAFT_147041 [Meira miltonrushii]PWN33264.1 hypothetical protein FA14DRAFT_147041 [Meira miltonrushii]